MPGDYLDLKDKLAFCFKFSADMIKSDIIVYDADRPAFLERELGH